MIIGSEPHPEVEGIKGWVRGPVTVISTAEEAEQFVPEAEKTGKYRGRQTTFNYNKFKDLVEIFSKKEL